MLITASAITDTYDCIIAQWIRTGELAGGSADTLTIVKGLGVIEITAPVLRFFATPFLRMTGEKRLTGQEKEAVGHGLLFSSLLNPIQRDGLIR